MTDDLRAYQALLPRYRIEHAQACTCRDRTPVLCVTPQQVALYLWGRNVTNHRVWEGECPYRFFTGNIDMITMLLQECAVAHIRPYLPCGVYTGQGLDLHLAVAIGEPPVTWPHYQIFRPIPLQAWLDYRYHAIPLPEATLP
jgi:hypothetical protein